MSGAPEEFKHLSPKPSEEKYLKLNWSICKKNSSRNVKLDLASS